MPDRPHSRVPGVYLGQAIPMFLAFLPFTRVSNLRVFNVTNSSIPSAPTNRFFLFRELRYNFGLAPEPGWRVPPLPAAGRHRSRARQQVVSLLYFLPVSCVSLRGLVWGGARIKGD